MVSVIWKCVVGSINNCHHSGVAQTLGRQHGTGGYQMIMEEIKADYIKAQLTMTSGPLRGATLS